MKYKAFLFDFDYTLAFSEPAILICYRHVFDVFGFYGITDETIKSTIGIPLKVSLGFMTGVKDTVELLRMFDEFQSKADEVMASKTELYPSAIPLIDTIIGMGAIVGIVSNKLRFRIIEVLERYNITKLMSIIIGIEDIDSHKPSPDGLLLAMERLGVYKEETLYIGDSTIDSQTAMNAGVDFVGVTTGTTTKAELLEEPNVAVISDLSLLIDIIQ